jgi:hypothetical protein
MRVSPPFSLDTLLAKVRNGELGPPLAASLPEGLT